MTDRTPAQIESDWIAKRTAKREARRRQSDRVDACIAPTFVLLAVTGLLAMAYPVTGLCLMGLGLATLALYVVVDLEA